jgi:hypothetical protein
MWSVEALGICWGGVKHLDVLVIRAKEGTIGVGQESARISGSKGITCRSSSGYAAGRHHNNIEKPHICDLHKKRT